MPDIAKRRRFLLFLIKPSHYDDDGYVIQWVRSALPSNSLACLYGIAQRRRADGVLGDDVDIEISPSTRPTPASGPTASPGRSRKWRRPRRLVGVQSNQFPRAWTSRGRLRAAGIPVCIGGFHVSGCLAMLPETPDVLKEALDLGISLFAGEAEGRFATCCATPRAAS